jgi:hypothetical protein
VLNTSRMIGATLGVAILGAAFAVHAGQGAAAGSGFLRGLQTALIGSSVAEFIGAVVAFSFIRSDSLHAEK